KAGAKRALEAAKTLHGVAGMLRVVLLPDLAEGGDVSDWLDADSRRADKLVDICFEAPLWTPEEDQQQEAPPCSPLLSPPSPSSSSPSSSPPSPSSPSEANDRPPPPWIDMSRWDDEPVPEQEWAVCDRIPLRQCALFSGEGSA